MTILTATTATPASESKSNFWLTSLYAGLVTAIIAFLAGLSLQWNMPFLYIPIYLLIGIGPVLGYQFAAGKLGDWKALVGGLIGFILPVFGWPILVGLMSKEQSVGKLLLASILGAVLSISAFLILATAIGQNPYWIGAGFTLAMAVWGGTVGAAMDAWREVDES